MHAIFFGLKRAFYGTLRLTRSSLTKIGLTAARFDLMYLLDQSAASDVGRAVRQSQIWRTLGVSASVVSRMLASLETLGLVRRRVAAEDKRQRLVELTDLGRSRFNDAMRGLVDSGQVQLALDSALAGPNWNDPTACFLATSSFENPLCQTRGAFGDTGTLFYGWHPDD